ncbi:ubiquinone biosynthesis O-methyltransferase, mitochondrial-like [Glandiceps talaboti]
MSLRTFCNFCLRLGRQRLDGTNLIRPTLSNLRRSVSVTKVPSRCVYILSDDPLLDEQKNQTKTTEEEVKKFQQFSQVWWNETGDMEALHLLNRLRVPLIRDGLLQEDGRSAEGPLPLQGYRVLDVGCGGGILSEPLGRLGANVTGIDLSEELIDVAELHSLHDPLVTQNVKYVCGAIEDLLATEMENYDAVVASEVLEHIVDLRSFVEVCCDMVKPGGSLFITSINKTAMAYALAVVAAETFNIVPKGSHEWDKLVSLQELEALLEGNGFQVRLVHGSIYNPVCKKWSWIPSTSGNFAVHAVKRSMPAVDDTIVEEPIDTQEPQKESTST